MCSSQRPEEGADSQPIEEDPPLVELPRAHRSMVEQYVREAMPPGTPESTIQSEVASVMLADALGRALHEAKRVGGPWPGPCVRQRTDGEVEQVPYGWGNEYECECEAMALHLIELMKSQQVMAEVSGRIAIAGVDHKEMN